MRALGLAVVACLVLSASVPAQAPPSAAKQGQLIVDVLGLHSDKGRVLIALFRSKDGFPSKPQRAYARKVASSVNKQLRFTFDAVPAGELAISLFHDENANNTLDTGAFGIPKEGWGMSRDAKAGFGPPDYDDARLSLAPGEHKRIVVHVKY